MAKAALLLGGGMRMAVILAAVCPVMRHKLEVA